MRKFNYLLTSIAVIVLFTVACDKSSFDEGTIETIQKEGTVETSQSDARRSDCATIMGGTIKDAEGQTIKVGYDKWGYNYQAFLFNGYYCDAYRDAAWCQDYKDVQVSMKWNDAWMSNKDCDDDGKLDRHYGFESFRGSGAWLTNHQKGTYEVDEVLCEWDYFVKIVAAPLNAYKIPSDATGDPGSKGIWYNANGVEIGAVIWDEFAVILEVENDLCGGIEGKQYGSPVGPGFGKY